MIRMLNESGADIIWVGLGAPKQEKWMARHKKRVKGLMMGVGAGCGKTCAGDHAKARTRVVLQAAFGSPQIVLKIYDDKYKIYILYFSREEMTRNVRLRNRVK